jgi:rSAM-associated Gly-rich repeat protein
MAVKEQISKALGVVLPGGALGASIVLALMSQTAVAKSVQVESDATPPTGSVAERLDAIRSGVAMLADGNAAAGSAEPQAQDAGKLVATWWGNGGWGRWHLGWGNGGWHNGGWGNGGWGNGGWHNWGNGGWHNWGNGWHNFWHNW